MTARPPNQRETSLGGPQDRPASSCWRAASSGRPATETAAGQPSGRGTVSALTAFRHPSGLVGPTVLSSAVCCSASALISAPKSTTKAVRKSQSSSTTAPASVPYVSPYEPKLLT